MNGLRKALGLVVAALATAAPLSPADAVGAVCVTGADTVYTGCTYVIVFPGFCYIGSEGAVAGTPYEVGPYRC